MCRSDIGGRSEPRVKCGGVDKDEETAMFGERTGESNANLYPGNWKQHSPAPELHSGPYGQRRARATWEGDEGQGDGRMDGWRDGGMEEEG